MKNKQEKYDESYRRLLEAVNRTHKISNKDMLVKNIFNLTILAILIYITVLFWRVAG